MNPWVLFGIIVAVVVLTVGGTLGIAYAMGHYNPLPEEVVVPPPSIGNEGSKPPPSTGGNGSGFPTDIVVPVPQPQDLQPLTDSEKRRAQLIVQNRSLLEQQISQESDPQRKQELQTTLNKLEPYRGTGIGPSAIPRKDHQNLEQLWNYLQSNDIWMQRRGNRENFW